MLELGLYDRYKSNARNSIGGTKCTAKVVACIWLRRVLWRCTARLQLYAQRYSARCTRGAICILSHTEAQLYCGCCTLVCTKATNQRPAD
eukprot:974648-Rhodomonas_salina.2